MSNKSNLLPYFTTATLQQLENNEKGEQFDYEVHIEKTEIQ